jgi:dihydrofolate reductase
LTASSKDRAASLTGNWSTRNCTVIGGADLVATFMRHDLIDEYRIYVHPVLLGRGNRLFRPSQAAVSLRLAQTHAFSNGVVLLRYERPRG